MAYRVLRQESRITIERDGLTVFVLERETDGQGIWALYPLTAGTRGAKLDRDQYANDLIERVTHGLICAGHIAQVAAGYVVRVPIDAGDFYVSSFGYLCCRNPFRMVLSEAPVSRYGITSGRIRPATIEERLSAGLDIGDSSSSALFLSSERG